MLTTSQRTGTCIGMMPNVRQIFLECGEIVVITLSANWKSALVYVDYCGE